MSKWRTIIMDSESLTGVAPECPHQSDPGHARNWVMDCCPHPHIECWSEGTAAEVAQSLTATEAELCG